MNRKKIMRMEFAELKNFQNEEDAMDDIGATEGRVVGLDGRTARLEGIVEQIDKRLRTTRASPWPPRRAGGHRGTDRQAIDQPRAGATRNRVLVAMAGGHHVHELVDDSRFDSVQIGELNSL